MNFKIWRMLSTSLLHSALWMAGNSAGCTNFSTIMASTGSFQHQKMETVFMVLLEEAQICHMMLLMFMSEGWFLRLYATTMSSSSTSTSVLLPKHMDVTGIQRRSWPEEKQMPSISGNRECLDPLVFSLIWDTCSRIPVMLTYTSWWLLPWCGTWGSPYHMQKVAWRPGSGITRG